MIYMINLTYTQPDTLIGELFLCFVVCFFSILFLQSALDKIFNFDANLNFLTTHFKKTFFRNYINVLFFVLILLELITGILSISSLIGVLLFGFSIEVMSVFIFAIIMSNLTICCLFLGQRVANDYPGAANLTIYFLVSLAALILIA